jgi:hypothetical protein
MTLLALLLLLNAALHAFLVFRFGTKDNMPVLAFAVIYAALAIVVFLLVPYALWAVLVLSLIGITGLTVTFGKIQRDKTLDRVIWVLDVVIIAYTAYLLFAE